MIVIMYFQKLWFGTQRHTDVCGVKSVLSSYHGLYDTRMKSPVDAHFLYDTGVILEILSSDGPKLEN